MLAPFEQPFLRELGDIECPADPELTALLGQPVATGQPPCPSPAAHTAALPPPLLAHRCCSAARLGAGAGAGTGAGGGSGNRAAGDHDHFSLFAICDEMNAVASSGRCHFRPAYRCPLTRRARMRQAKKGLQNSAAKAYQAWLGYYNGNTKRAGVRTKVITASRVLRCSDQRLQRPQNQQIETSTPLVRPPLSAARVTPRRLFSPMLSLGRAGDDGQRVQRCLRLRRGRPTAVDEKDSGQDGPQGYVTPSVHCGRPDSSQRGNSAGGKSACKCTVVRANEHMHSCTMVRANAAIARADAQ